MSRRPVIGVTGNNRRWSPSWLAIKASVWLTGGKPLRINIDARVDPSILDGLIISGGDDIDPALYGGDVMPKSHYDRDRDELEQEYIREALERDLPLLGICRGYQLINVVLGGRLQGDIRPLRDKTSNRGTILPRKTVFLTPGSLLATVLGKTRLKVNSLHSQALDDVAGALLPVGHDLDKFVQAFEARQPSRQIVGVQWHPEYLLYLPSQLRLFRWLVAEARKATT